VRSSFRKERDRKAYEWKDRKVAASQTLNSPPIRPLDREQGLGRLLEIAVGASGTGRPTYNPVATKLVISRGLEGIQ
jgi:hypothetical protein